MAAAMAFGPIRATAAGTCCPGDMDANNQVNDADVSLFVLVVLTQAGTPAQLCAADVNGDGLQNGADVSPFTRAVLTGGNCVPTSGACCLSGGACQLLTSAQCTSQNGCYQGDGSVCAPNPCACPVGFCDIDGSCLNGCEVNINHNPPCSPPLFLGSMSGDTGAGTINQPGIGEKWYSVRLTENNNGVVYLSARITLQPGPTSDYDLYIYCANCGGAPISSSTGGVGQVETVFVRNDDDFGSADDFTVVIEVRFWSGGCDGFQLVVNGNTAAPSNNCDP